MSDFAITSKTTLTPEQHAKTPDGDYTQDFLDAGTKFSVTGAINSDPIPVEKAWVENGVLHLQGRATWAGAPA